MLFDYNEETSLANIICSLKKCRLLIADVFFFFFFFFLILHGALCYGFVLTDDVLNLN